MEGKTEIHIAEAKTLIDKSLGTKEFVLLDVRTLDEYRGSHIKGSVHIELQTLEAHIGKLNKQSAILVYCRSGKRSDVAANLLRTYGFKTVTNMLGGILAWAAANLPTASAK